MKCRQIFVCLGAFLLFPFTGLFSQKLTKDELRLSAMLDTISVVERLYQQVDSLEKLLKEKDEKISQDYYWYYEKSWMLNYQIGLRTMFDQLESTGTISFDAISNGVELEQYVWQGRQAGEDWLIELPAVSQPTDFSARVNARDTALIRIYPKVFSRIASKAIVLEVSNRLPPALAQNQVLPVVFPVAPLISKTNIEKKKIADMYLQFISTEGARQFGSKLISSYLQLELKKVPDGNLDKLIEIRRKFIEFLKTEYAKQKN